MNGRAMNPTTAPTRGTQRRITDSQRYIPKKRLKAGLPSRASIHTCALPRTGGEPVVVFWKSGTRSALDEEIIADSHDPGSAAAFSRRVGERILEFEPDGEFFRDTETGTLWTLLGVAGQPTLSKNCRGTPGDNRCP